ncbi:uncharacterized protein [Dendropsophus ebraccatus]|uniref:uncharacterized protein n=1 Tax=Dendropsophus ebraccatus TaxID=150705 RepID=UPI00383200D1
MGSKWTYCISCLYLISCYTRVCFTQLPVQLLPAYEDTLWLDQSNSSPELDHVNPEQNSATQTRHLIPSGATSAKDPPHGSNLPELGLKDKEPKTLPDSSEDVDPSFDFIVEDEDHPSTITNLTSTGNRTFGNLYNSTLWWPFIHFPNYVICQFSQGCDYMENDLMEPTFFGSHKLLALFLGMAGVLAFLLILIYCIYIRQHKEEMFSHHKLYGEGFEDPVLHLDTPVDHLDFFSFRDTELTPAPTPQHKCYNPETYETKEDYKVEVPKGTSSNEHLHQILQMGSIRLS